MKRELLHHLPGDRRFSNLAGSGQYLKDGLPLLEFLDQQRHHGSFEVIHKRSVTGHMPERNINYSTIE